MDRTAFMRLQDFADQRFPGLRIKYKRESWHQRLLSKVWPNYGHYTTVLGDTIYFPDRDKVESDPTHYLSVLAHELVHLEDQRRLGRTFFLFLYFFPQSLAGFALLALLGPLFPKLYWALVMLAFLAPIPAPFRTLFELRGYQMSLAIRHWQGLSIDQLHLSNRSQNFTGATYWFMWPFKGSVRRQLEARRDDVVSGRYIRENDFAKALFNALPEKPA